MDASKVEESSSKKNQSVDKIRTVSVEKDVSEVLNPSAVELEPSNANNSWLNAEKVEESKPAGRGRGNRGEAK